MKCLLLFFAVCLVHQCAGAPGDGLIFAHVVFRHGDRNIYTPFGKNDPFSNEIKYWPGGFQQLTDLGRQQQYELGQYLAKRYRKLIGNKYSDSKVYCRSTNITRAMLSAYNTLAGMFPSSSKEKWNPNLESKWTSQVNTIPEIEDFVLATKKPCKQWLDGHTEVANSPEMKNIVSDNAALFEKWENLAGRPIKKIGHVNVLYQTLKIEKMRGFEGFPSWAEELVKEGTNFEKIAFKDFEFYGKTPKMARIRPGFLLKEILERFSQKASGSLTPDRSLWLYSAHDVTIANILGGLGVYNDPKNNLQAHIPPYSSCVFFELHRNKGKYHIEVYYKRDRGVDKRPLQPLRLRCGPKCPLNEFYDKYNDIIPTKSFDEECHN
ncbi:prostatic acid phosphatase-like [Contarinia nasturtii]|uniref:prostatic acid phosphatase-like n=1 Tax=Contarinia nasturtii TaxID=265458 RepID=UPI0012D37FAC|nr:prostatic acid phosphatase-like [Contarinia nasturtii]